MRFEELIALLLLAVPLIWLIGFVGFAFVKMSIKLNKKTAGIKELPSEKFEKPLLGNSDKHLNEGKSDERMLEVKEGEVDTPVIDMDNKKYYQNLGDKLRQDENNKMLAKMTDDQSAEKKMNFETSKAGEQAKQRKIDKEARNQRMLDKLKGYRIKRKIAKKAAKKNIQLDEKMIEKIKLRALAGKMR